MQGSVVPSPSQPFGGGDGEEDTTNLASLWKDRVVAARQQLTRLFPQDESDLDDDHEHELDDPNLVIAAWMEESWIRPHFEQAMQHLSQCLALEAPREKSRDHTTSKEQILTVRTILRYFLVTLGGGGNVSQSTTRRRRRQEAYRAAVQELYCQPPLLDVLGRLVSNTTQRQEQSGFVDVKSSTTACRLLTNLVTGNPWTSCRVLTYWDWQPDVATQARRLLSSNNHEQGNTNDVQQHYWLDLFLAAATSDRSALAALVAGWYNALQAIYNNTKADNSLVLVVEEAEENHSHNNDVTFFAKQMVEAELIVSNVIRHALPSTAVLSPQQEEAAETSPSYDEATEWITWLVAAWCQWGPCLSTLFHAAAGRPAHKVVQPSLKHILIVPEQVILLQLLLAHAEGSKPKEVADILGTCKERMHVNVHFLANNLYSAIGEPQTPSAHDSNERTTSSNPLDETTKAFGPTVRNLIRELLAQILAHEATPSTQSSSVRDTLVEDQVVATWIGDLARHLDQVQERFCGRPAKDVVLTQEEQRLFVSLVRLLGNLCHGCRKAQDCLRQAIVPMPPSPDHHDSDQQHDNSQFRTGLHVLLSCTSLSHTCFTLREWSVVAIRNALENNPDNQAVVAELQAQQAVPSAPLAEMGMQIQLEKNGKVCLKPINEEK